MTTTRVLRCALLLLVGAAGVAVAQTNHDALAGQLTRWETLLGSGKAITPQDVAEVEKLDREIAQTPYKDLIVRGALVVALYRENLQTKAESAAVAREISAQAALMNRQARQHTKEVLAKVGFWTGVGAIGLTVVSATMSQWAFGQYATQSNTQVAADYFTTGRIANLVTSFSLITGLASFGLASFELFGLYSTPVPPGSPMVIPYPSENMTNQAKIAYLDAQLKDYAKHLDTAQKARRIGTWSLLGGVAALVPTVIFAVAESNAFSQYSAAGLTPQASNYQAQVNLFKWGAIATGSLAAVGFAGALTSYLFYPDPTDVQQTMSAIDSQRASLEGQ